MGTTQQAKSSSLVKETLPLQYDVGSEPGSRVVAEVELPLDRHDSTKPTSLSTRIRTTISPVVRYISNLCSVASDRARRQSLSLPRRPGDDAAFTAPMP